MKGLTFEPSIAVLEGVFGRGLIRDMVTTASHLRDTGGPIDVFVLLAIAGAGAIGVAILVSPLDSFPGSRRIRYHER